MLASLIALRKAMKKYPIQHAVSFHGSIQRAELFKTHNDAFSKSFRKYGKLETFHVSGKTPTGTRARIIGEFARAERALITNARCLTEGVDVPGIDCVLFADPRRSAVDIVQAVGRALRPAPGKQFGYVIVPILHDADATADDIFKSPAFKEILTTLRALAANDDRIIEYFRGISKGQQRKGGASVQFDIDERLAKRIDLADFVREIELKCWDRLEGLQKDRLTIEQILEWADKHHTRMGKWPNVTSGIVLDASDENWKAIDGSLCTGKRGLPGASSLAQRREDERGTSNRLNLPDLTEDQILRWADSHYEKTGQWPTRGSGNVLDALCENWARIDGALRKSIRGLQGGSSLTRLLAENRGFRNRGSLPNLTIEQILNWADEHRKKTGEWPTANSGNVIGAPGEKWKNIGAAIYQGLRGMSGGSSLARLLDQNRSVRNRMNLPDLTEGQILRWADSQHERTGQWPNRNTGIVSENRSEKWKNIDASLTQGCRGLAGNSSLSRLLAEKRGVRNASNVSDLTVSQILDWADSHHEKLGIWPKTSSGSVLDAPSEKWKNIDGALYSGKRGLSGGSSLARLLAAKRGIRNEKNLPTLTIAQILDWAKSHYKKTGQWPKRKSGEVLDAPDEKWSRIGDALINGYRGLPGGILLSKLIATERNAK